jgi:3-oxoacyl-[acyl-carrier protein] reductase
MADKLVGQRVLITGGGRGIGRAIAIACAREGAQVAITARSADQLAAVAAEVQAEGGIAVPLVCDVGDAAQVEAMVEAAQEALGGVNILVNNAGGGTEHALVAESTPAQWQACIDANLIGTYACARFVLPGMIAAGAGKIINIGSGMGHEARAGSTAYNTAKAAVWMFTKCLALEVWEHGIDVNEIVPGPVLTPLTADRFSLDGPPPFAPSERVKLPEEVADLTVWLASQPPGGPTGQSFSLARRPPGS